MAGEVDVGGIVVRLIADAKQLEAALEKGGANLKKFGAEAEKSNRQVKRAADETTNAINSVVRRLTGLVAAYVSVNTVVSQFNREITVTTQLDHLSQVTGVAVTSLAELRGVVLQLGIDFDVVRQAVSQFAGRMTEALASSSSRGSQAARALGISLKDTQGNLKSFEQILTEMAERFPQFADGANKAAIASALLGEEAGPRFVPLLNQGVAGLERLRLAARGTFNAEDVQRARQYQEVIGRLQIAFETFFREITRAAGPALTSILSQLTEYIRKANDAAAANDRESRMTRDASQAYDEAAEALQRLMRERDRILSSIRDNPVVTDSDLEQFRRAEQAMDKQQEKVNQLAAALALLRGAFSNVVPPAVANNDNRPQAPALDPFAIEKAQLALERIMDRLSGQRDIFDSINLSWQEHANVVQQALSAIDRANDQNFRREAARHRFEMQQRRMEQDAMLQVASTAAQTITTLWPKQKGAAIAAAIINTAVGITQALRSLPPPWSWAQAALIAASGAAQIASIRSTNSDGTGGSAPTPAPAEAAPDTSAAGAQPRSLSIQGLDPAAIFSGRQVEELIRAINNEVQNGATLISTRSLPR